MSTITFDLNAGEAVTRAYRMRASVAHVSPFLPAQNATNLGWAHSELGGQLHGWLAASLAKFSDAIRCENAASWIVPVFGQHIGYIFGVGSKKQMIRINAGANVALVTDEKSGRNWTSVNKPRNSMGCILSSLPLKRAVSAPFKSALPEPTTSGMFLDIEEKFLAAREGNRWFARPHALIVIATHTLRNCLSRAVANSAAEGVDKGFMSDSWHGELIPQYRMIGNAP